MIGNGKLTLNPREPVLPGVRPGAAHEGQGTWRQQLSSTKKPSSTPSSPLLPLPGQGGPGQKSPSAVGESVGKTIMESAVEPALSFKYEKLTPELVAAMQPTVDIISFAQVAEALSTLKLPATVKNDPSLLPCGKVIANQLVINVMKTRATSLRTAVAQNVRKWLKGLRALYVTVPKSAVPVVNKALNECMADLKKIINIQNAPDGGAFVYKDAFDKAYFSKLNLSRLEEQDAAIKAALSGFEPPDTAEEIEVLKGLLAGINKLFETVDFSGDLGALSSLPGLNQQNSTNFFAPYKYCMEQWDMYRTGDAFSGYKGNDAIKKWFAETNDVAAANAVQLSSAAAAAFGGGIIGTPLTPGFSAWMPSVSNRMLSANLVTFFESASDMNKGVVKKGLKLTPPALLLQLTAATEAAISLYVGRIFFLQQLLSNALGPDKDSLVTYSYYFNKAVGRQSNLPKVAPENIPFNEAVNLATSATKLDEDIAFKWFMNWRKAHDAAVAKGPQKLPNGAFIFDGAFYTKTSSQMLTEAQNIGAEGWAGVISKWAKAKQPKNFFIDAEAFYQGVTVQAKQMEDPALIANACGSLDAGLVAGLVGKVKTEILAILGKEDSDHAQAIVQLMSKGASLIQNEGEELEKLKQEYKSALADYDQAKQELEQAKEAGNTPAIIIAQSKMATAYNTMIQLQIVLGAKAEKIVNEAMTTTDGGNVGAGVLGVSRGTVAEGAAEWGKSHDFKYTDNKGEEVTGTVQVDPSAQAKQASEDATKTNEDTGKELGNNYKKIKDSLDKVESLLRDLGIGVFSDGTRIIYDITPGALVPETDEKVETFYEEPDPGGFPWFLLIGAGLGLTGAAPVGVAAGVAALELFRKKQEAA